MRSIRPHFSTGLALALAAVLTSACGTEPAPPYCDATIKCGEKDSVCATYVCSEKERKCVVDKLKDDAACDDGLACNVGEKCKSEACVGGAALACDDGDPCTADSCSETAKGCEHKPATGAKCDDGKKCTVEDVCTAGTCAGLAKPCKDSELCTDDGCDPITGECTFDANTKECDDDNLCTSGDKCKNGTCAAGAKKPCNDDNGCTTDSCDPASGDCVFAANTQPCDDNDLCTKDDVCAGKVCKAGVKEVCNDNEKCTDDSCDKADGACKFVANSLPCDDGDACTKTDTCKGGACKGGDAVACDDGNPCTSDACDSKTGKCVAKADDSAKCSDGSACTSDDGCVAGVCVGTKVVCPAGKACTVVACDKVEGCVTANAVDQTPCDDGNACTIGEACKLGGCTGGVVNDAKSCGKDDTSGCKDWACDKASGCKWTATAKGVACSDGSACTEGDACDGGGCIPGKKVECNDGNACTDDACDKDGGCKYVNNTKECSDGNECTLVDVCLSGKCAPGKPKVCDDGKECTVDDCNTKSGECTSYNADDGVVCEDGDKCTETSGCKTGKCVGIGVVVCKDDGNVCTDDGCDAKKGCAYGPKVGACDADGNVCTVGDACSAGVCVAGTTKGCDDGNVCTDDSCDKLKGCLYANNLGKCDDGLICTEGDGCKGGSCSVFSPKDCSDGNSCTEDVCDPKTGCGNPNSLNNSTCDDGNACSTGDACTNGACKSSGAALWVKKDGTVLQDSYFAATVGQDGTVVAVGRKYTGTGKFAPLFTGTFPDKSVKFEAKLVKTGPQAQLNSVTTTATGAFVAVGCSDPKLTGACQTSYVVQVNANGKVEWEVDDVGMDPGWNSATDVVARTNGGVVMVGDQYGPWGWRGFLWELTSSGTAVSVTKTDTAPSPFLGQWFKSVAVAPGGGYWVGSEVEGSQGSVARLIRFQSNGDFVFGKLLATPKPKHNEVASRLLADADGVTIFGLTSYGSYGNHDAWVARADNSGNIAFKNFFGGPGFDAFTDAVPAESGGYFVSGYWTPTGSQLDTHQGLVGMISTSGHLVWQRLFSDVQSTWRGIGLIPAGALALAGYTHSQTVGDADTLLGICDQYGNCDCTTSGNCLTKTPTSCNDKNPCSLDWCDKGSCQYAIGNEGQTCDTNKTCQKGKCL